MRPGGFIFWLPAACGLAILGGLNACNSPSDPPPVLEPAVSFVPAEEEILLQLDQEREFRVRVDNSEIVGVEFFRADSLVGQQPNFVFTGSRLGIDTLVARVSLPSGIFGKEWHIEVEAGSAPLPPSVRDLQVDHGQQPGSIVVGWTQSPPSATPRPVVRYIVKASNTGVITEENWDQATGLGTVAHEQGQGFYLGRYGSDEFDVIQPGQTIWVAVRVEDVAGLMSPLGTVIPLRVTAPYYITGNVRDGMGTALNDVIVDFGCDTCKTTTATDGSFELGPFRDDKSYVLRTRAGGRFYDFRTDTISAENHSQDIFLIRKWGVDPDCVSTSYAGSFLKFFRSMTRTAPADTNSNRVILWKWDDYPISVFVFPVWNTDATFRLRPLALKALDVWNERLQNPDPLVPEEPYFEVVGQQDQADLTVIFTDSGLMGNQGLTEITDPPGNMKINQVIPRKMLITVKQDFADSNLAVEVVLHELGHALCMGAHSSCNDPSNPVHIMSIPFSRIIEFNGYSLLDAISEDEKNVVRSIRFLPQGTSMEHYIVE